MICAVKDLLLLVICYNREVMARRLSRRGAIGIGVLSALGIADAVLADAYRRQKEANKRVEGATKPQRDFCTWWSEQQGSSEEFAPLKVIEDTKERNFKICMGSSEGKVLRD